jgi:N-hydroxyarylamine O-acetyltransferase
MPFQQLDKQELQQYLQRIRCNTQLSHNLEFLKLLHHQHALQIPFENLNSWLGLPVSLTKEALLQKLAIQERGGYCFEHNLLLGNVLTTLGFTVHGLAARVVWMQPAGTALARTHMVLLTTLNQRRYLVDVGFGGMTLTSPLLLDTDTPQQTSHENFRISQEGQQYTLSVLLNGVWQDMYCFELTHQQYPDYEMANWFVATHPQSRFVNNLIAAKVDTDGRHALQNLQYTRHYLHKESEKTVLESPDAVRDVLKERFRIDIDNLAGLDERLSKLFAANSSS